MTGCVDEGKEIFISLCIQVGHGDRITLSRNPPFTPQIHGIEQLFLHLSLHHSLGAFEQSIGQSCLAVIDVSDDAKISNPFDVHHKKS